MTPILPNLFIVGAPKCGTTTLHDHLVEHVDIREARLKETGYFLVDRDYELGVGHFFATFGTPDCGERYLLDSTPWYLYGERAIGRIVGDIRDAKAIICLRDPVRRALSSYQNAVNVGSELRPPDRAFLESEDDAIGPMSHVTASRYERFVPAVEQAFGADRTLVVTLERMSSDPEGLNSSLERFLGIPRDKWRQELPVNNVRMSARSPRLQSVLTGNGSPFSRLVLSAIASRSPRRMVRRVAAQVAGWNRAASGAGRPIAVSPEVIKMLEVSLAPTRAWMAQKGYEVVGLGGSAMPSSDAGALADKPLREW